MSIFIFKFSFFSPGYTDPGKDLRKAVKAKEKAAKKAKKEKKRKGIKEEDLFDPKNLEKYRKELEEKRKLAGQRESLILIFLTSPLPPLCITKHNLKFLK